MAVLTIAFAALLWWNYDRTRKSYRAVGFNDGRIHQREETMRLLTRSLKIPRCEDTTNGKFVEFVSVKADAILMQKLNESEVAFCRYGNAASNHDTLSLKDHATKSSKHHD
jgi:hypothetical protein